MSRAMDSCANGDADRKDELKGDLAIEPPCGLEVAVIGREGLAIVALVF